METVRPTDSGIEPRDGFPSEAAVGPVQLAAVDGGVKMYMVSGYAEAQQVLAHKDIVAERQPSGIVEGGHGPLLGAEAHKILASAAGNRMCESLRPATQSRAAALVEAILRDGRADLMDDFVLPVAFGSLFDLFGIPAPDREKLRKWSYDHIHLTDVLSPGDVNWPWLEEYVAELEVTRPAGMQERLLGTLLIAVESGELSRREAVFSFGLTLMLGYSLVARTIGETLLALVIDHEKREAIQAELSSVKDVVEEMLRFLTPAYHSSERRVESDARIGCSVIPSGSVVVVALGAANRDERQFPHPDAIDFHRGSNSHLAFGYGPHYCIGAALARMEAEVAIMSWIPYLNVLSLAVPIDELVWSTDRFANLVALRSLPVECKGA
jgi:cytochrome P450